jgi:glycosyltransferase involved in cell wall biosynthesis
MGEVLEHHADYQKTLEAVESYVKPGGLILLTFPSGPTESLSYRRSGSLRLHIRHFEFRDVQEIFAKRTGFDFKLLPWTVSHLDASLIGMWLVRYVKTPGQPVGEIDLERKVTTARPYNRISVCLITKDEEESIVRCLKSVRDVADEIILADTGSTDQTLRLAEPYVDRILSLPASPEGDGLGNFSAWRNASIAPAKGEWILWIDADETLVEASHVRRYLEGPLFNAFVLKQRHMMLDFVAPDDTPMRLFRNHRGYQFFGVIHEHVEEAMDVQISPALVHPHSYVAHYGYLNEKIRRAKCRERNLPLLKKDLQMNPHRLLSKVLAARDYINFMHWAQEAHNTPMNEEVKRWALEACTIHRSYFTDPRGPHFRISFKNYQTALEALGKAGVPVTEDGRPPFEIGLLLLGGLGGITQRNPMEPQFVWCWDRSEAEEFFARQTARLLARLEGAASAVA